MPSSSIKPPKNFFFRLDAHYRLYIALVIAAVAYFVFKAESLPAAFLAVWIAFALTVIVLDWVIIFGAHPREIRKIASLEDSSRTAIFIIVLAASVISLAAIYLLLKSAKGHGEKEISSMVFLSMGAVITSWILVHTIFALRYAHLFYDTDEHSTTKSGLEFPKEASPDYLDFVYFSFVVGMTFQVSDVEISSRRIRRLTLVHGLVSFAFNTAIVALSINIISGLISS
ncbi:DUF1345 domain-containing protein [Mucilaginibacter limnophilus]|uniref:DUF1345 domain-containing protein n=1 Tax=Mucilaginibacter limnophilus TaxID=1932778 RepID=A0A437MFZ9_9SPHI|nr:DUF1345 domain-containing protein [Mucilaginibacter limnophilus]RVT96549.1 DUF1345 domain-containing protein [Mucilaginibacter limnophilus]